MLDVNVPWYCLLTQCIFVCVDQKSKWSTSRQIFIFRSVSDVVISLSHYFRLVFVYCSITDCVINTINYNVFISFFETSINYFALLGGNKKKNMQRQSSIENNKMASVEEEEEKEETKKKTKSKVKGQQLLTDKK